MTTKVCTKCGIDKNLEEFYKDKATKTGRDSDCKICANSKTKKYRKVNPEKVKIIEVRSYLKNKEKATKRSSDNYRLNPEKSNEMNRKWRKDNPQKASAIGKRKYTKKRNDPKGRLNDSMRSDIRHYIHGTKAGRRWEDLVGYTVEQLKKYLGKLFDQETNWDNYGTYWHVDHKIPVSAFNFACPDDIDFKKCWALSNLQPLEANKNMSKGNKLTKPHQPSLLITL